MRIHLIAATLAAALAAGTPSAWAQGIEFGPGGVRIDRGDDTGSIGRDDVSRREAIGIARDEGLRDVDDAFRRGRHWVVDGSDRRGRDIRVTIDARSGNVIDVQRD